MRLAVLDQQKHYRIGGEQDWKRKGEDGRENVLAALSNLFIIASPESVWSRVVSIIRSSSVRNFAVSGQSQTQNLAIMPTITVRRPSMMKILFRVLELGKSMGVS